jgi:hypothetical protein
MIRVFKKEGHDNDEIRVIDTEIGTFKHYLVDKKIGFPYSFYETNVFDMGYVSAKECIEVLKERKIIGAEIDYKVQKEAERIGYINLGVERIRRAGRINTNNFEDGNNLTTDFNGTLKNARNYYYSHKFNFNEKLVDCVAVYDAEIFLQMTIGKKFISKDKLGYSNEFEVQGITDRGYFILSALGSTLKRYSQELEHYKKINGHYESVRNLTLEEFSKIEVEPEWFNERTIKILEVTHL